jgi:hypothetical protein
VYLTVIAFLNGLLKEGIYLEAPEILNVENGVVCKLWKTLYGLKLWKNPGETIFYCQGTKLSI